MRFGREGLILIGVPLVLLVGTFLLIFRVDGGPGGGPLPQSATDFQARGMVASAYPMAGPGSPDSPLGAELDRSSREGPESQRPRAAALLGPSPGPQAPETLDATGAPAGQGGAGEGQSDGVHRVPGRVTDSQNRPVAGARVVVRERLNLFNRQGSSLREPEITQVLVSDAQGTFQLQLHPEAVYEMVVAAEGYVPQVRRLYGFGLPEFILSAPARIGGRVIRADSFEPLPDATVALITDLGPVAVSTDQMGRYLFQGVPTGSVILEVTHPQHESQRVRIAAVAEGQTLTRDFVLVPGGTLTGQVVMKGTQEPVSGVVVAAYDPYRQLSAGSISTDGDGGFRFRSLRVGSTYWLTVNIADAGYPAVQVAASAEVFDAPIIIEVDLPWSLQGVTQSPEGQALTGVRILLRDETGDTTTASTQVTFSDALGNFHFSGLGSDRVYSLMTYRQDLAVSSLTGLSSESVVGPLLLVLVPGAGIEGRVLGVDGTGIGGVLVRARGEGGGYQENLGGASTPLLTYSDASGRYAFHNLGAGMVTLTTLMAGYQPVRLTAILLPGEIQTGQDLTLIESQAPGTRH